MSEQIAEKKINGKKRSSTGRSSSRHVYLLCKKITRPVKVFYTRYSNIDRSNEQFIIINIIAPTELLVRNEYYWYAFKFEG